jgi:hypothetical protein
MNSILQECARKLLYAMSHEIVNGLRLPQGFILRHLPSHQLFGLSMLFRGDVFQ